MDFTLKNSPDDPFELFKVWYAEASGQCPQNVSVSYKIWFWLQKFFRVWISVIYPPISMHQPDAMVIATTDESGQAFARVVLLKGFDERGLVFYSNYKSKKGQQLERNPKAAALFHWGQPERQVRIQGVVEKISHEESSRYWNSRDRGSQISGATSPQSQKVSGKAWLHEQFEKTQEKYMGQEIPCPEFWGGYVLIPKTVEYWQGRANRFHDRILYEKTEEHWQKSILAP